MAITLQLTPWSLSRGKLDQAIFQFNYTNKIIKEENNFKIPFQDLVINDLYIPPELIQNYIIHILTDDLTLVKATIIYINNLKSNQETTALVYHELMYDIVHIRK